MCRIAGFWDLDRPSYDRTDVLRAMRDALIHGGPDACGEFISADHGLTLGHRRLSIIDLSNQANQPMHFQNLSIAFNGEVYNYREIKSELEQSGYDFETNSDTEVVLKAFHCWGKDCVSRFHGMWAIAIFDSEQGKLFLCRDRLGVKPLFYYKKENILLFASELKAFFQHPLFVPEINFEALGQYLKFGFITAPHCIYKHAAKLLPGHWLEVSNRLDTSLTRYWSVEPIETEALPDQEWVARVKSCLKRTVGLRMVSDVPVGVFLSGGIDSSLVAALLQAESEAPLKTFTIGFDNPAFDESGAAKQTATLLGTDHREWVCTEKDALESIYNLPEIFDEPLGDSSVKPTLLVAQRARDHVKVALSADGGDELFGGYDAFHQVHKLLNNGLEPLRFPLSYRLARLLGSRKAFLKDPALYRKELFHELLASGADPMKVFELQMSLADEGLVNWMLGKEVNIACSRRPDSSKSAFDVMARWDLMNYLPDDILVKVDRATMHVALEGREPLLDQDLVDLAFNLPDHLKYDGAKRKVVLRKILSDYLPSNVIDRPKRGFTPPLNDWFRGELSALVDDCFDRNYLRTQGVFDPDFMQGLLKHYRSTHLIHPKLIWNVVIFQLWFQKYFR
ncbi:MAG: asparagine synthase (glutamine-hydrolyzing) [Salibacteraceae bacterium]